jgi:glyoxylate/hydroxypyruvate reductase A
MVADVFSTEPLPAASALWEHPRVTVTPHNAAVTQPEDVATAFAANLARFEKGGVDALDGVFSWNDGY